MDLSFVITNVFSFGVVEIKNVLTNNSFKMNGHRLKHFFEGFQEHIVEEVALQDATNMS